MSIVGVGKEHRGNQCSPTRQILHDASVPEGEEGAFAAQILLESLARLDARLAKSASILPYNERYEDAAGIENQIAAASAQWGMRNVRSRIPTIQSKVLVLVVNA
jgi:hypothetical protein